MDIYKIGNKTQIFLLEIPATAVDFFANVTSNIENDITKKAREGFDTKINSEPIQELQTQDWKDRTEFPIGMNEKGEFFYTAGDKKPNISIENKEEKNTEDNPTQQNKPWWKFW